MNAANTPEVFPGCASLTRPAPGPVPLGPAHQLFERQAGREPGTTALIADDSELTAGALNGRVNRLGAYLHRLGARPGDLIGVHLARTFECVTSILAALKVGGVCVPMDPAYPAERIRFMAEDARVSFIVSQETATPERFGDQARIVALRSAQSEIDAEKSANLSIPVSLEDPAYITYTSGSAGTPKGVVYSHRHLVHRLDVIYADDVCLLCNSFSFGFSISRLFPSLIRGAPLVLAPEAETGNPDYLLALSADRNVTSMALVPSALEQLLDAAARRACLLPRVRSVTVAGAAVSRNLVERFFAVMPAARLWYGFGSSETGPATLREIRAGDKTDPRNVGKPLPNNQVLVLAEDLTAVPAGMLGELCVASRHLAIGYLNQPELSAARFVNNPFPTGWSGDRLFRTGDFARYLENGEIEVVGRADNQVKIRGYRVELYEVEFALTEHEDIAEAAVAIQELHGEQRLVAYVVPNNGATPTVTLIRRHLDSLLPQYMHPTAFVVLNELPLTSNGKLDRQALPRPTSRPEIDSIYRPPGNALEQTLVDTWEELLEIQCPGVNDDFMDLGGDSLFVTRLAARIWDGFGLEISWETLYGHPTIAELAAVIAAEAHPPEDYLATSNGAE